LRHGVTIGLLQYNVARELTAPTVAANPMRHLLTPEDIGAALLAIERLPATDALPPMRAIPSPRTSSPSMPTAIHLRRLL
jgi:hypothetical protein